MKKKLRCAAMLAGAVMLCSTLPVSAALESHPVFSWRTDSGAYINGLQPVEDSGLFGDGWRGQIYYTRTVRQMAMPITNDYTAEEMQERNTLIATDTLYHIIPRNNYLTFHLRSDLDTEQAEVKAAEILSGFFSDLHDNVYRKMGPTEEARLADFSKRGTYGYYEVGIHSDRGVQPDQIMNSLYDAGLIDEFYTYGDTALYEVISTDLTQYFPTAMRVNPETNRNEEISIDWDAVEAWLTVQYPDCSLERPDPEDEKEPRYTVNVPYYMTFEKHYALAVDLYEQFGISPIADMPAIQPQLLLGTNQLIVKQYGEIGVMYERIARWQETTVDQCIVVSDTQFLTPTKPYQIVRLRYSPYRITFRQGTKPDWDVILNQWIETLREGGYPENILESFNYELPDMPESAEFANVYDFRTTQDAWAQYSLLDVLEEIPEVEKIEAQFGYRTDSQANSSGSYRISLPLLEDASALNLSGIQEIVDSPEYNRTYVYLDTMDYAAYFDAIRQLHAGGRTDAGLAYTQTELASAMDDAYYVIPYYETLYECSETELQPETSLLLANVTAYGDMNEDGTVDISDAVMLARFAAEDSSVRISQAAVSHADFDGDGNVTGSDVIVILRYIAKLI